LSQQDAERIYEAFIEFQHHAQRAMILMIYRLPAWLPRRASEKCARRIRAVLAEIIARRYAERAAGQAEGRQDILAGLMEARDPVGGDGFSYEEMVDQICMLFLAGHETSASALAWCMYLISHHAELQERMVEEIEAVAGGRAFEFADIKKLRLTWDVFREALRLYPPVGFFVREATEDHCLRDKQVKTGSPILLSPWLIHRHQELWERPNEFDPGRFATPSGQESLKCAYLPFSMGPRVCIGAAFATQEAVLILASLVRRYRIEAVPEHVPKTVGRVTIRSDNGIRVRLQRRPAREPVGQVAPLGAT
jgi:cytochrome P450